MRIDCHVHVVGNGTGGTGCWYRPRGVTKHGAPAMLRSVGLSPSALTGDLDGLYAGQMLKFVRESSLDAAVILAQDEPHRDDGTVIEGAGSFYVPNDYVLLQQEIGVGFNVLGTPGRKLRTGVSANLFDLWNTAPKSDHSSRGVASMFEEVEWTLPWRMTLTQRGVWYPVRGQEDGWENRIELNKKLTETLSTSVRHEIRRNNPDGSAQDYTRMKLLFGFDF